MPDVRDSEPPPAASDGRFRLTLEQRALVPATFDVDALERLLRELAPEERDEVFAGFLPRTDNQVRVRTRFGDPRLQALLDDVWAPYWDTLAPEALTDIGWSQFPGWEIAKERRRSGEDRPAE